MQADCFQDYIQCAEADSTRTIAQDLLSTLALIRCNNAHLYESICEHHVGRPGEADMTGKAVMESDSVVYTSSTTTSDSPKPDWGSPRW